MIASKADLLSLVDLEHECFPDAWGEKVLGDAIDRHHYLFLLEFNESGLTTGYFIGSRVFDEAEILRIGVRTDRRGHGIGKKLLDEALRKWHDEGVSRVFLEVRRSNEPAIGLYRSHGFEKVATRLNYYEDGEDALIMGLNKSRTK